MNGVVTFVKKGLTVKANSRPLDSPDLDDQGRCVMTDHGSFVLFNVYVPAGGGQPLSYKMKFLNALRAAMQQQRRLHKKPVILVGDLNISHTKLDKHWSDRVLFVNDIRRQVGTMNDLNIDTSDTNHSTGHMKMNAELATKKNEILTSALAPLETTTTEGNRINIINRSTISSSSSSSSCLPSKWMIQLAQAWPKIESALQTKQVVATQTTNPRTNEKFEKFRLKIEIDSEKSVYLGRHESSPEYCTYLYDFGACSYQCSESDETILVEEENVVSIKTVGELMAKIAGIFWDESTLRAIAASAGQASRNAPPRKWLNSVIDDDLMVDAFRFYYPNSEGRYTCWNQFTNKRYTNEGARIDYTLVDKSLLPYIRQGRLSSMVVGSAVPGSSSSRSCNVCDSKLSSSNNYDPDSEEAALCAVTANGKFRPVSFEGGGIIEASKDTLDTQFSLPHTGMLYTPPSFSDHIAVSLLLDDEIMCTNMSTPKSIGEERSFSSLTLDINDSATKKSQPHKAQKTISSFFATKNDNTISTQSSLGSSSNSNMEPAFSSSKKRTITTTAATSLKAKFGKVLSNNNKKRQHIDYFFLSVKDEPKSSSVPSSSSEDKNTQQLQASSSSMNSLSAVATNATKSKQVGTKMSGGKRSPRPGSIQNYLARKG